MSIDSRLLDSACQANIDENFDRTLAIVDAGGGLPEIAAGDAGKVLTVNNDEDAAVWATPGGGVLVVNVTEEDGTYTCDKTAAEMWAAVPLVCLKYEQGDAELIKCLTMAGKQENSYMFADSGTQFEAASGTDYPASGGIH